MVDDLNKIFIDVDNTIEEYREELSNFSKKFTPREYKEIKSRSILYDELGKASASTYRVAKIISSLYLTQTSLKELKKALRSSKDTYPSLRATYLSVVEDKLTVVADVLQSAIALKDGVDSVCRFYQSVQYMLGSPRLEGI